MKKPGHFLYSSYSVGLAYEKLAQDVLKKYSFHLKHTGGTGDRGEDLVGQWILSCKKIPIIGQCKCLRKPVGPREVREFEGVLYRKFTKSHSPFSGSYHTHTNHVGLMVSRSWFSVNALRTLQSSQISMIFIQILESPPRSRAETHHRTCQKVVPKCRSEADSHTSLFNSEATSESRCHTDLYFGDHDRTLESTIGCIDIDSHSTSHSFTRRMTENGSVCNESCKMGEVAGRKDGNGYIGEIALNSRASKQLGHVRLSWKYETAGQKELCRELVIDCTQR